MSDEAVEELAERYQRIGGRSPLDEVTEASGPPWSRARHARFVGMKHWRPRSRRRSRPRSRPGRPRIVGLVLAPHYSRLSVGGYRDRLEDALGDRAELVLRRELGSTTRRSSKCWQSGCEATGAWVVFTAHSLPERILAEGDPYREQLLETAHLVAARAGLERWSLAFQSASATGELWLGPDVLEELDRLKSDGSGSGSPRGADRLRLGSPRTPWNSSSMSRPASARASSGSRAGPDRIPLRRAGLRPRRWPA